MNSCLGPISTELVTAIEEDNLHLFSDIISERGFDANEEFADYSYSTILHLAVKSGKTDFVRELLRLRSVNPNHAHKVLKRFPIHVAAEQVSS